MNVSLNNGWGIVRTIADLAMKQPEGKYVLVKDPNSVSGVRCRLTRMLMRSLWSDCTAYLPMLSTLD